MRILLDEMYSPAIAEGLRRLGHDALSVHDRPDLAAARDESVFAAMKAEERVIVTNNVRDFMPLAHDALRTGSPFPGLVLTSDRSLPRNNATIGSFIRLLDALMSRHAEVDALAERGHWLTP